VIARNCALRILEVRHRERMLRFVDDLDSAHAAAPAPADPVPQQTDPFVHDFYRLVETLPPLQRAVVLADLRAGGMAPAAELAAELQTTTNSIYVSRTNGRKALRAALRERGHEFPKTEGADAAAPAVPVRPFQRPAGDDRTEVAQ
jgi:DNA-directed RNA polymerase specialized sigma24 family protein